MVGQRITSAISDLVDLANQHQESVKADFNGVEIIANPGDNILHLLNKYQTEAARKAEEYRNSPEGKRVKREAEERKRQLQGEADRLMSVLDDVDFDDLGSVIAWFEALQDPSDQIGVSIDRQRIRDTFAAHGYHPDVYSGDDFVGSDREIYARWLIGQALSLGPIPGIYQRFADEWRERFSDSRAAC